jgi:hypothetical protein
MVLSDYGLLTPIILKLRSLVCSKTNLPKQIIGGTSWRKALIWESLVRPPRTTGGAAAMSKRVRFAYHTLLMMVMIGLPQDSPTWRASVYVFIGRYLDLDEPCLVRRTITVETRNLY